MYFKPRFVVVTLLLIGLCKSGLAQYENLPRVSDEGQRKRFFAKTASTTDEGIGVLTQGQLRNLTMNYGAITDTRMAATSNAPTEDYFNFIYPAKNSADLCDDFSLIFACRKNSKNGNNGNVVDSYVGSDDGPMDWNPKDGSYGNLFYKESSDPLSDHSELIWVDGTPYLAHSDLLETWPVDENGTPFWPGKYRTDPNTGKEMLGEFAADREVFCVFDDASNQDGEALGIEIHMQAYAYGRSYAEDFQFYDFKIINTSDTNLDSCWFGCYWDPDCGDYYEDMMYTPDVSRFDDLDNNQAVFMSRDIDSDKGGATIATDNGIIEDYNFGFVVLKTPHDMGITDYHYFFDKGPEKDSQLWPIITSNPDDKDIPEQIGGFFHGPNQRIDNEQWIYDNFPNGWDWSSIQATGPFDFPAKDTVYYTIVVLAANDDDDFYANVNTAVAMYRSNYQGPAGPPAPALSAVPGDGQATLYWDASSENIPDQSTGELDFEGYKLYRSEDGGATWGQEIIDALGNFIGYVPIAQYDLVNNFQGFDPINGMNYLGNNTGIKHFYVDSTVYNGVEYVYTITAYDCGKPESDIESYESGKGGKGVDKNFKKVTPRSNPSGYVTATENNVTHIAGIGKAEISLQILDPGLITGADYQVKFNASPVTSFFLYDSSSASVSPMMPLNTSFLSPFDGVTVQISANQTDKGIESITDAQGADVWGVNNNDTSNVDATNQWFVTASTISSSEYLESRASDYEIRFTEDSTWAFTYNSTPIAFMKVLFQAWNVSDNRNVQVACLVKDFNNNKVYDFGDEIIIVNTEYQSDVKESNPLGINLPADNNLLGLTLRVQAIRLSSIFPLPGQKIVISQYSPLTSADVFSYSVTAATVDKSDISLDEVRVVPNPYIVNASWEVLENVRRLLFMFLPEECDIDIYTISGDKIKTIHHTNGTGDEEWNLVTDSNVAISYGVYIYVISTPGGDEKIGKFAVIK